MFAEDASLFPPKDVDATHHWAKTDALAPEAHFYLAISLLIHTMIKWCSNLYEVFQLGKVIIAKSMGITDIGKESKWGGNSKLRYVYLKTFVFITTCFISARNTSRDRNISRGNLEAVSHHLSVGKSYDKGD